MELNDRGVQALTAAIIVQSAKDWLYCRKLVKTKRHGGFDGSERYNPGTRMAEVERFMRGKWFTVLTDLDGEYLLGCLREMQSSRLSYSGIRREAQ